MSTIISVRLSLFSFADWIGVIKQKRNKIKRYTFSAMREKCILSFWKPQFIRLSPKDRSIWCKHKTFPFKIFLI